jgi:O-antigen/teichoic acid export membrane protein
VTAGVSAEAQLGRIARGGAVNLAGSVVAGLSGFLLIAVVTRNWDAHTAGTFFSATSLLLVLSATALLGTDTGLARFILRYEAHGRGRDVGTLLRVALPPVAVGGVLAGAMLAVFADLVAGAAGLPEESGADALRVFAVALPVMACSDAVLGATRAFGAMRPTVLVDRFVRAGGQPLAALAAAIVGGGLTALAVAWSLPYALALGLGVLLLMRQLHRRGGDTTVHPARPVGELRREFWRYTSLRGVAQFFQVALQRIDIVLVAALRSPREAAIYTAATRFVVLGQLGVQAIQQVLQPRLSELIAHDDRVTTRRVFRTATAWVMALSWPVYLVAATAAPLYLRLFGPEYEAAGQRVVVVLAVAMLLATAAGSVDVLLLMAGRSALSLINSGVALAVNVAMNLLLIPLWGIEGAAVSWAVAIAVRNALSFWQVRRLLGITALSRAALVVALAGVTCFAVPLLAVRWTVGLEPLATAAAVAVGTAAYVAVLWHRRELLDLASLRALRLGKERPA